MSNQPKGIKPQVLILFFDTGGGRRSAAETIVEVLSEQYGDVLTTEMVDIFKQHAPHCPGWSRKIMPAGWGV